MKTHRVMWSILLASLCMVGSSVARADDSHGTEVSAAAKANAGVNARDDLAALKEKIATQGEKVSEEARAKSDKEIGASMKEIDDHASADGDAKLAARLGDEFGISADAVMAEKSALGASWGELTIAHSIAANSNTDVTVEQLMEMRKDGMGWGKIAAGLDLELGSVVSGVREEARVARGIAKADGKAMAMKGPGARPDVSMKGGVHVDAGVGHGKADVAPGAGVKVKVKGDK